MTDHPRDEFDAVPETSVRQGAHREKLVPAPSGGPGLAVAVGALALLVGLCASLLVPGPGPAGSADSPAAAPVAGSADSPRTAGPSASADPRTSADVLPGAGSGDEADPDTSSSAGPGDAGDVDRGRAVDVLNATGAPGLASTAAARLTSAGWISAVPGNWAGAPVDASVVFHDGEEQRAGAEEIAAVLGIPNIVDSPDVSTAITAVLGPDFP